MAQIGTQSKRIAGGPSSGCHVAHGVGGVHEPRAWDLMATFTFNPKQVFPTTRILAEKEVLKWCGLVGWMLRTPVAWLVAPERHKSGQWHAHALLAGLPSPKRVDALINVWQSRNGAIDVRPVKSAVGAVLYSSKDAALVGDIIVSDTVADYRCRLLEKPCIALHPTNDRQTSSLGRANL